jgi:hypothetical protein
VAGVCAPVSCLTNASGQVTFTYSDTKGAGTDTIDASTTSDSVTEHATASQVWTSGTPKKTDAVTLTFGSAPTYEPQSPVAPGTSVSLGANVNPNGVKNPGSGVTAPTGTITFYDGSTALTTVPVNGYLGSGYAADLTSKLGVGNHEITAAYSGDSNYPSGTSNQVQITVTAGVTSPATATPTRVGLNFGSAPTYTEQSPVPPGNRELFTATVTVNGVVDPGSSVKAPTGTVSFYDNKTTLLGTSPVFSYLGSSYVSLSTTTLPGGNNEVTAVYNGDPTHPASTSNQVQVTIPVP